MAYAFKGNQHNESRVHPELTEHSTYQMDQNNHEPHIRGPFDASSSEESSQRYNSYQNGGVNRGRNMNDLVNDLQY